MNRPVRPKNFDWKTLINYFGHIKIYDRDLEKYCDKLEKENDEYRDAQHTLFIELCKYKKALDKACYFLEQKDLNWLEFYPTETNCIRNDKEWKDFLMNEVNNE